MIIPPALNCSRTGSSWSPALAAASVLPPPKPTPPMAPPLLLGKTEANLTQVYDEIEAAGHPQPVVIPFNLETALPHQYR